MTTYNTGDRETPAHIHADLERIETALGDALCTADRPCAAVAYYDDGEDRPWRIADDHASESFATAEEAIAAAEQWERDYAG